MSVPLVLNFGVSGILYCRLCAFDEGRPAPPVYFFVQTLFSYSVFYFRGRRSPPRLGGALSPPPAGIAHRLRSLPHVAWRTILALWVCRIVPSIRQARAIHAVLSPGSSWGASCLNIVTVFCSLCTQSFPGRGYHIYAWVFFPLRRVGQQGRVPCSQLGIPNRQLGR